ncbi:MAG: dihydroorotase [Methanobacteriota archaeon]
MGLDLVVKGRALLDGEPTQCCIGVKDGLVAEIRKVLDCSDSLDFGDALLLPAAVDLHVHLREPGKERKEDFFTGTMAAAFGGVSCVADMPNTVPMTSDAKSLREKHLLAGAKANVDYGLWGLLATGSDFDVLRKGTVGFKFFMSETTGAAGTSFEAWPALAKSAGPSLAAVHPEHPLEMESGVSSDLEGHSKLRNPLAEARGIAEAGALFANVHMCHVSSRRGLEALAKLKEGRGGGFLTAEVTPHHLFLNSRSELGAMVKVNPPLREKADQAALWEALASGAVDTVSSDHAPHTLEEKRVDFEDAPSGLPGVETGFPLMLKAVKDGRLTLARCVEACCTAPAKRLNANKGVIAVGYDADLVAVSMRDVVKIRDDDMHSKCGWTPYAGMEAIFPRMTMVRGQTIVRNGSLESERCGRALPIPEPRK